MDIQPKRLLIPLTKNEISHLIRHLTLKNIDNKAFGKTSMILCNEIYFIIAFDVQGLDVKCNLRF